MSDDPAAEIDPSRVRATVFDLGGVLTHGGPREVVAFGTRVGLDERTWERIRRDLFGNEGTWARLERGETSFDGFVEEVRLAVAAAGGRVTTEEAATFMGVADPLSRPSVLRARMIDSVGRLREVMPTALLTNNVREWRGGWRSLFDCDRLFDVIIDSSEVGARKPETKVYEVTRERLGVAHAEILFIDDIGQNLKAARALGWQTVLFTDEDDALALLDRIQRAAAAAERHRCP